MKIRNISIDFSTAKIFWAPKDPEFAQFWNATSSFLPYLEPFLNRVVKDGMDRLSPEQARLREDCRIFIAQEGEHYTNHAKFNAKLRADYPQLLEREMRMKADYETFWKKKGFKFSMAYAEGFETMGPIWACYFLENARELKGGDIDDPTLELWRWHLAEEYEHRHVCNYLFHAHFKSYLYRLYGIAYAAPHMMRYMIGTTLYLLKEDYRSGRIKHPWKSRLRMAGVVQRMIFYLVPRVLKTLSPAYDPVNMPMPRESMQVLAQAEEKWGKVKPQKMPS